jgi:hypothetical protein
MSLVRAPYNRVRRPWVCALVLVFCAGASIHPAFAQAQCTATATVSLPGGGSLCAANPWVVSGTETAGPHPNKVISYGATQPLQGVCTYSYLPCNPSQPASSVTVSEHDPTATAHVESVSSTGEITVTVQATTYSASANPTPCKCTDASPQGYTGVTVDPPVVQPTETFYGQC